MELWELIARESIRDLVARYNANLDTARYDQAMELFAPDAEMEALGKTWHGREGIKRLMTGTAGAFSKMTPTKLTHVRHSTSTLQIDLIDQTHAKARCYYFVIMDHGLDHWGRYMDEFGVVDGKWLFTKRRATTDQKTRPIEVT
jgi:hypothetical protein